MKDRLKELRTALNITQEEFANRVKLTRNYIALVEAGSRVFSDRVISDVCRQFSVNEKWFRTGEGDMFIPLTDNEQLSAMLGDLLHSSDGDDDLKERKKKFISTLLRMTPDEWDILLRLAEALK